MGLSTSNDFIGVCHISSTLLHTPSRVRRVRIVSLSKRDSSVYDTLSGVSYTVWPSSVVRTLDEEIEKSLLLTGRRSSYTDLPIFNISTHGWLSDRGDLFRRLLETCVFFLFNPFTGPVRPWFSKEWEGCTTQSVDHTVLLLSLSMSNFSHVIPGSCYDPQMI